MTAEVFHRRHLYSSVRKGYILRSTLLTDDGLFQPIQTFIPEEDFDGANPYEQRRLVQDAFTLIESKIRELAKYR